MPGNHEHASQIDEFCQRNGFQTLHRKSLFVGGVHLAGLGHSNPTPFNTPGEDSEETIATNLEAFAALKPLVLICHCPPLDTALDEAAPGRHFGSSAVRAFVDAHQPEWFLCGHIHEAAGRDVVLGQTRGINVGQARLSAGTAVVGRRSSGRVGPPGPTRADGRTGGRWSVRAAVDGRPTTTIFSCNVFISDLDVCFAHEHTTSSKTMSSSATGKTPQQDRSEIPPGTLYMLILKTLARLGPLHGYGIAQYIQEVSEDVLQVEEGSLYPALQRMLIKGWIVGEWGLSENNRRARFYRLTPDGEKQLTVEVSDFERVTRALMRIIQPA